MMQHPRYRSVLRSLFTAILQSDLSSADLRLVARELRRGQLSDELAYMLDRTVEHFRDNTKVDTPRGPISKENRNPPQVEIGLAERLIEENKISRSSLINIMRSIGDETSFKNDKSSTKVVLSKFFSTATNQQIDKLIELLSQAASVDPYLKGIADTRK